MSRAVIAVDPALIDAAVRQGVIAAFAELRHPMPATKAMDPAFRARVQAQREAYMRDMAEALGLDPDAVVKQARTSRNWSLPVAVS